MLASNVLAAIARPRLPIGAALVLTLGACNALLDNDQVDEVDALDGAGDAGAPVDGEPPLVPDGGAPPLVPEGEKLEAGTPRMPVESDAGVAMDGATPAVVPDAETIQPSADAGADAARRMPEVVNHCAPNPCGLGTCTDDGVGAKCTCPDGFSGFSCETRTSPLKNVNSRLCLGFDGAIKAPSGAVQVVQQACSQQPGQIWEMTRGSDGFWAIRNKQTKTCIGLEQFRAENRSFRAILEPCDGQDEQKWSIGRDALGQLSIKGKARSKCLIIIFAATEERAHVGDEDCSDAPERLFQ